MQKKKGFTLIELLVVIAIIAILAAILFPVFARARENARRASCQSNLKQLALGIFQYTQDYDERYPTVSSGIGASGISPSIPYGWADALQPYLKSTQLFQCPSETGAPVAATTGAFTGQTNPSATQYTDYWINRTLTGQSQASIDSVSLTIMNGDGSSIGGTNNASYNFDGCRINPSAGGYTACPPANFVTVTATPAENFFGRHLDGANYAFADGHVKWLKGNNVTTGTVLNGSSALRNNGVSVSDAGGRPTFAIN